MKIKPALPKLAPTHPLAAIAADLTQLVSADDAVLLDVNQALSRFLPAQLARLDALMNAQAVTLKDVPPDIARDWVLPDGRARVQLLPKAEARDSAGLRRFDDQVLPVAPNAGGAAIIIVQTADTIIGAFRSAALTAIAAIAVILFLALRRPLDVALVMAPLLLSALLTVLVAALAPIPLNFANIIALPLLLGVGRLVQYLFCDELAGRTDFGSGLGHGAGNPVLRLDDRNRLRLPGHVGPSRHRQHGHAAAGQPGLHADREPGLHSRPAGRDTEARRQPLIEPISETTFSITSAGAGTIRASLLVPILWPRHTTSSTPKQAAISAIVNKSRTGSIHSGVG